jgi:hypothetical protein
MVSAALAGIDVVKNRAIVAIIAVIVFVKLTVHIVSFS